MRALNLRDYKAYESSVFGISRYATRVRLDSWLSFLESQEQVERPKGAGAVLPAHGGPKLALPFQDEIVRTLTATLEPGGRALVALPTGAGKTFTTMRWLLRRLESESRRVVWVAPQRLLLEQAEEELRAAWYAEARHFDLAVLSDLNEAAAETSLHFSTFQALLKANAWPMADIVVADEAHHTEANEFGSALDRLIGSSTQVVGLSATPGRRDKREFAVLAERFGNRLVVPRMLGGDPVQALRDIGVYATIENRRLQDQEEWRFRRGPESRALSVARLDATVDVCRELGADARALIFCYSLAHCQVLASALFGEGLPVAVVGSAFSRGWNRQAVEAFRAGRVRFLVNVKYLAVGADFPFANVAILTVPVESPIQFEQAVGRVARGPAVGGTDRSIVYDFDEHFERHGAIQSYTRFWQGWWRARA